MTVLFKNIYAIPDRYTFAKYLRKYGVELQYQKPTSTQRNRNSMEVGISVEYYISKGRKLILEHEAVSFARRFNIFKCKEFRKQLDEHIRSLGYEIPES